MPDIIEQIKTDLAPLDRKAVFALVYAAAGLTGNYYLKDTSRIADLLQNTPLREFGERLTNTAENNLISLAWWVGVVSVFYFVIPVFVIRWRWRESIENYGLLLRVEPGFWRIYLSIAAFMLPLVYLMSLTEGFAAKYPFFKIYNGEPYIGSTLVAWELLYFVQFFGLEFFFRGFLVHALKRSLGMYSIFVMTVPYCMIHFGKPPAETFAAILAGIFLGWLSYRNGSIWLGLLLHCTVAFSMDILALYNKGLVF